MESTDDQDDSITAASIRAWKCPYKGCSERFLDRKSLIAHKIEADDHEYCKICDHDSEDYRAFIEHKVNSPKHICCPACGVDFKSKSGMSRHIRIDHKKHSPVTCAACQRWFATEAGFVQHYENDWCRSRSNPNEAVRKTEFDANCERKAAIHKMRNATDSYSQLSNIPLAASARSATSAQNAVPNRTDDYLGDIDEKTSCSIPAISPSTAKTPIRETIGELTTSFGGMTLKHAEAFKAGIQRLNRSYDQMGGLQDAWSQQLPVNGSSALEKPRVSPDSTQILDVEAFWNKERHHYQCPFKPCPITHGAGYGNAHKRHISRCSFRSKNLACAGCSRTFKTNHALFQHMSNATERCRVQYRADFREIVDRSTGGFLDVAGEDKDGNKIYVANAPENRSDAF